MIALPNDNDDEGGLGGLLRPQGTRDTRLLEKAVRERWPIPEDYRKPVVDRMYAIVTDESTKAREASIAARVLVAMEGQNLADEHKRIDKRLPDLHAIGGLVEHRVTVAELLEQPEYAEWLRERERHLDAGDVSTNGHAGNGKPVDDGHARNGH